MTPPPVVPPFKVAKPVRSYLLLAVEPEDELELLEDDELLDEELEEELDEDDEDDELLELLLDEDELEDELLLEEELDEDDELEDELELLELLAGAKTATDSASWLELFAVQLVEAVPAEATASVELAPPLPETDLLQRTVWLPPAVNVAFEAPLHAASTSQELAVATVRLAVMAVPVVAVAVLEAPGALCATPLRETAPTATSLTEPPKVMAMVWAPEAGASR
jgi:hypothetical protein